MTLTRTTPLKAKRAKPRQHRTPRCERLRCDKRAVISGLCIGHAEREADRMFSAWVRRRDGGCTAVGVLPGECRGPLVAAHIEGRRKQSVRFDPDNVHALCDWTHHAMVDQHASHAAKARWAIALLGPNGYHELIERAAVTLPRAVAVERALGWLKDET